MQLGGVVFDKTLAKGPSAAPVRFCLWHTVRIDSSCAHVSPRGPHRKRCAAKRGPPCKQGATIATLYVLILCFVFKQNFITKIFILKIAIFTRRAPVENVKTLKT